MEENKKDKNAKITIVTYVLWAVAIACMAAGAIMIIIGMRPVQEFIGDLFGALNGGGIPDVPAASEFSLAIGGIVLFLAGIVFLYVANAITKNIKKDSQEAVKNAQMLMQLNAQYMQAAQQQGATEKQLPRKCLSCGKPIDKAEYKYCPYCGKEASRLQKELEELATPINTDDVVVTDEPIWGSTPPEEKTEKQPPRKCLYCGKVLEEGEEVCSVCGHVVKHE